jgi:tetratricopeptide (TPR) repeat protein
MSIPMKLVVPAVAISLAACGCRSSDGGGVISQDTQTALAVADSINLAETTEVDLVEELARARQNYRQYLRALITYYNEKGFRHKAVWAERELKDLDMVKTYRYLVDAEVPGAQLRPRDSIAEADALFDDGVNYMKQGGHGVPLLYNTRKLKKALEKFNRIIREYPTSDKIDDAAFYAGEIYKEYFNDNLRAVQYYRRVWEWNPETTHPARFQAAVVYDYRLHDRDRALELYQQVLEHEQFNRSNVRWAVDRIKQLTENPDAPAPAEPGGFEETAEQADHTEPAADTN